MEPIRADEINEIIRKQIENFETGVTVMEVGTVIKVGDGIAEVHGLEKVMAGELLEFPHEVRGLALNLEEDKVGAVLFGDYQAIKEGDVVKRTSRIMHTDGSVVFEMKDAEIPADWSQLATDIVVSKYFRKAGVPVVDGAGQPVLGEDGKPKTGPEKSVKHVVHRLAGCWRYWGEKHGYFDTAEDAQAFYDELSYMLLHQMCAPNSPQWFNTGLNFAYGITGPA
jgi:hypothetical protein